MIPKFHSLRYVILKTTMMIAYGCIVWQTLKTASYIYRLNQIVRIIVLKIVIVGISISFNTEMVDHLPSEQ
ncbi:hypothetical protein B5F88_15760 [Flavonifractor sp. An306]|nr:hypothetical protein B5F88_15760 [Flavonifractor sp. An306]